MKKMLYFSYDFPPLEGGISRLGSEIVKQFIQNNWEVNVLSVKHNLKNGFDFGYPVTRVESKRGLREWESYRFLKKVPKDTLIITGVWYPEALIALLAGHKNIVVLAHGNEVMKGKKTVKNFILNFLRKLVLRKARKIICNSNYTMNLIKSQVKNANVDVCNLGVDIQKFYPIEKKKQLRKLFKLPLDKKIILTVSRLNKYKAHDVVMKALSKLPENVKDKICYCIAGRGENEKELKELAKSLNIENMIKWLGFVKDDKLPQLYNASDLFVLCTREEKENKAVEGFGLVFLEAQACGLPVIGANQGGIPDAVKENNGGWLIEKDDFETLSKYFIELVNNPQKFVNEGKKGRKRVEKDCTWEKFSKCVFNKIEKGV